MEMPTEARERINETLKDIRQELPITRERIMGVAKFVGEAIQEKLAKEGHDPLWADWVSCARSEYILSFLEVAVERKAAATSVAMGCQAAARMMDNWDTLTGTRKRVAVYCAAVAIGGFALMSKMPTARCQRCVDRKAGIYFMKGFPGSKQERICGPCLQKELEGVAHG